MATPSPIKRPIVTTEAVSRALRLASETREAIQFANFAAEPVPGLLLLPLIAQAAQIEQALAALMSAMNAKPE